MDIETLLERSGVYVSAVLVSGIGVGLVWLVGRDLLPSRTVEEDEAQLTRFVGLDRVPWLEPERLRI